MLDVPGEEVHDQGNPREPVAKGSGLRYSPGIVFQLEGPLSRTGEIDECLYQRNHDRNRSPSRVEPRHRLGLRSRQLASG